MAARNFIFKSQKAEVTRAISRMAATSWLRCFNFWASFLAVGRME
jgi:hypothetical protein